MKPLNLISSIQLTKLTKPSMMMTLPIASFLMVAVIFSEYFFTIQLVDKIVLIQRNTKAAFW